MPKNAFNSVTFVGGLTLLIAETFSANGSFSSNISSFSLPAVVSIILTGHWRLGILMSLPSLIAFFRHT